MTTRSNQTDRPEEAETNDLALRGVPAELPPPEELERLYPDAVFLISYSRISDDWRKHSKKAASSMWTAGKGVANQHRRNGMNAKRFGAIIVRHYTDNDLSASKKNVVRPDFRQMLRDLERGRTPEGYRIDGVIVVDQDRVQRTDRDWEDFVEALTADPRRRFWTPSGPSDLTEESEIIRTGVMALVNKAESLKKKRRIRDWHQDRILDGLPHSGPRPFGWNDDKMTLRKEESDFLAWSIDERIKGKEMTTLCEEAWSRGLTGTKGGKIIPQTLTQMMTAPRVCGFRANKGELVLDEYGNPKVGQWERITTPEKWRAVCATFGDGSTWLARGSGTPRITGVPKTIKYLGSTLLTCQNVIEEQFKGEVQKRVCATPMGGSKAQSKRSPYVYTCPSGRGCGSNAISGPMVDKQLTLLFFGKLAEMHARQKPTEAVWPLAASLEAKERKLRDLEASWQADGISSEMFFRMAPPLEQEVKKLRREKTQWESESIDRLEAPEDVMRKWKTGEYDLGQKRKLLFMAFSAVLVRPGQKGNKTPDPTRLTPVWK